MIAAPDTSSPPKLTLPAHPERGGWRGWPWLAMMAVLAARLFRLAAQPLPDHDSGRNWRIIQALVTGDGRDLFVHLSPTWYLAHTPLAGLLAADFRWGIGVNAFIGVAAVAWLSHTVARAARLSRFDEALLTLLLGLGTLYTYVGREFAVNSPGLFVLAGVLHYYQRRLTRQRPARRRRALWAATAWLAVGLTVNYRLALLLPLVAGLECVLLWRRDRTLRLTTVAAVIGLLAAPFVLYAGVALLVGLPWYRLPAAWYALLRTHVGPREVVSSGFDGLFYVQYLLRFESPLALAGLVGGGWWLLRPPVGGLSRGLITLLALLGVGCFLLATALPAKAPRGLLFALGPLTALGALVVWQAFGPNRLLLARTVLLAAIAAQAGTLWRELGRYYPPVTGLPPHAQVAVWLRAHNVRRIATTAALGVAPYAAAQGVEVFNAPTPDSLRRLVQRHGCRYVLADGYRWAVGFDSLPAGLSYHSEMRFQAPALLPPMLFLEHAEYLRETYDQALERQQRAAREPAQLELFDTRR